MDRELKDKVLRLFLQHIQKYVPLDEAIVASLGGEGREAALWQEAGISGNNGWLIERKKTASQKLISQLPYRYMSSLGNFSKVFRSVSGSKAGIDAFHLDLCGTIEPSVDDSRRIIPLVVKSRGRCLAITVADARRNLSVEQFGAIEKKLKKLLGFRFNRMWRRLAQEKGEDRELAMMREIGFFFHLMDLLRFYGRYAIPNRVRRYAYISHSTGTAFPMRTYFFHFSEQPSRVTERKFAQLLYREWFREQANNLNGLPPERVRTKESLVMSDQKSADIYIGVGVATKTELTKLKKMADAMDLGPTFDKLVREASAIDLHVAFLTELSALIRKYDPKSVSAGDNVNGSVPRRNRKPAPRVLPEQESERIQAQLRLVEARSKGVKAYGKVRVDASLPFVSANIRSKSNRDRKAMLISRALYAQTQKGYRPAFLKRVAKLDPNRVNADLASWFSKIMGKEVTVDELRTEAGL